MASFRQQPNGKWLAELRKNGYTQSTFHAEADEKTYFLTSSSWNQAEVIEQACQCDCITKAQSFQLREDDGLAY